MRLAAGLACALLILGVGFVVGIRRERRIIAALVRAGGARAGRTALVLSGLHAVTLVGGSVLCIAVSTLAGPVTGSLLAVVLTAAYAPLVLVLLPSGYVTPRDHQVRGIAEAAGAGTGTARVIAILGGAWSFVGLGCCLGAYFAAMAGLGVIG